MNFFSKAKKPSSSTMIEEKKDLVLSPSSVNKNENENENENEKRSIVNTEEETKDENKQEENDDNDDEEEEEEEEKLEKKDSFFSFNRGTHRKSFFQSIRDSISSSIMVPGEGIKLRITWKQLEIENSLAIVNDIQPKLCFAGGESTNFFGSGELSKECKSGTYHVTLQGYGGWSLLNVKGDCGKTEKHNIGLWPFTVGTYQFNKLEFPVKPGKLEATPNIDIHFFSKNLPKRFLYTTTTVTVWNEKKELVFKVQIQSAPEK